MKLFKRSQDSAKPAPNAGPPAPLLPPERPTISLTAEEKNMLEQPMDPRVARILEELRAIKVAEEQAPGSSRIIRFPESNLPDDTQSPIPGGRSLEAF